MKPTRFSRVRRLCAAGVVVVVLATAILSLALPWLLALPFAQRQLKAAANRILAPSRVEFGSIALSWNHSTTIKNFVLHDAQGDKLLISPRAVFNWSLSQIVFARPTDAQLLIEKGNLDIERFADGSVDLYQTLKPVISEHPPKRLVIRIPGGSLRFRDPAFPEPVIAENANLTINLGMLNEPIRWDIHLQRADQQRWLDLVGMYSRAEIDQSGQHDLELSLKATNWSWTLTNPWIESRGLLNGSLDARRKLGRISTEGDATMNELVALGPIVGSDTIHVDTARARWKIDGDGKAWNVERLDVTSPLATVQAEGCMPPTPDRGAWLQGDLDLAALARQLPQTLHLRDDLRVERGGARLRADVESNATGDLHVCNITGKVTDLIAHQGQKTLKLSEPASLNAKIRKSGEKTTLERFQVQTPFLTVEGEGDLDRGISARADIDLAVFRERFRDWLDLGGIVLAGKGSLSASYRRQGGTYDARSRAELRDLRLDGLPVFDQIERNRVSVVASAGGGISPSGWPRDWRNVTFEAKSGADQGKVVLASEGAGRYRASASGQTDLRIAGRQDRALAELSASGDSAGWTIDRIALGLAPRKPGQASTLDEATVRWNGRGRYDWPGDILTVESSNPSPERGDQAAQATWIGGDQRLRLNGVRSWPSTQVEAAAKLDLASAGRMLLPENESWTGSLDGLLRVRPDRDLWNIGLRVDLHQPAQLAHGSPRFKIDGDVGLAVTANYAPTLDKLDVLEIGVTAPYVQLDGAGSVKHLAESPDLDLKGRLALDWPAIERQLAQKVEPGAKITGRSRPWRLSGKIPADLAVDRLGGLRGEIGVQIDSLDVFGMRLTETPIVVRAADGQLVIDPIDARLNGGVLHADPQITRQKNNSTWLQLSSATRLDGAVINDEVSHRVLSFVAPVLDGATRVQGRVSFELDEALLPIGGAPKEAYLIQGKVLFDDVRFMPGELADQLLGAVRLDAKPIVELREPVSVRITEGKIHQRGLVLPVGNLASIALDGSVDFDRNLDMVARFALNRPRTRMPVLSPLVENARFELPIRGTLAKPKIDSVALKEKWKAFGGDLLQGSIEAGMNGLQMLLQGMPNQPFRGLFPPGRARPTTPDERRQLKDDRRKERLEKKAARRKAQPPPE